MATLASIEDLKARVDRELDERELKLAQSALVDASELARFYGRNWEAAGSAPRLVRTLVLRACMRYMHNPEGIITSRAGDETLAFSDRVGSERYGTIYFTDDEQQLLSELAGRGGSLVSANTVAWDTADNWECRRDYPIHREGWVPTSYGGKPFPLYNDDNEPW